MDKFTAYRKSRFNWTNSVSHNLYKVFVIVSLHFTSCLKSIQFFRAQNILVIFVANRKVNFIRFLNIVYDTLCNISGFQENSSFCKMWVRKKYITVFLILNAKLYFVGAAQYNNEVTIWHLLQMEHVINHKSIDLLWNLYWNFIYINVLLAKLVVRNLTSFLFLITALFL